MEKKVKRPKLMMKNEKGKEEKDCVDTIYIRVLEKLFTNTTSELVFIPLLFPRFGLFFLRNDQCLMCVFKAFNLRIY